MRKNLIILLIGVVVGFILYSLLLGKGPSRSDAQSENDSEGEIISNGTKSSQKPFELREEDVVIPKQAPVAPVETRTHGSDDPRAAEPTPTPTESPKRILNFEVSEPEVHQMEANLDTLQKEVSLFREERGWVVKFYSSQNALADTGVRDGDLIRFNHLDTMKRNPETAELAQRLEDVLLSLQR